MPDDRPRAERSSTVATWIAAASTAAILSAPARVAAAPSTDAAMPPDESAVYRSSAPPPTEAAMPPDATTHATARRRAALPAWLRQHAPGPDAIELSLVGGVFVPSAAHELYDGRVGFRPLARAAPSVGARIDYFALPWFGFELEGTAMPTRIRGGGRALLAGFRGGLVLRLPWRLAPFVVGGVGALAVSSGADALGDDLDESFHVGGGLQFFVNRWFAIRLDGRDHISHRRDVGGGPTHQPEVLAAVTLRLGGAATRDRAAPPDVPADHDGDRLADAYDHCPNHPGPLPHGCPQSDRDDDGVVDDVDACADTAGVAPSGCPTPTDDDGDGLVVPDDRCPAVRGSPTDGCPIEAPVRVHEAISPALADLEGVLVGVAFATGEDKLTVPARATLSRVADALQANPGVRVEIVGHTDDRGDAITNRRLSARRADAVVRALVERGVAAERLVARGAGGDEPIATNATAQGRAINRRVELTILRD